MLHGDHVRAGYRTRRERPPRSAQVGAEALGHVRQHQLIRPGQGGLRRAEIADRGQHRVALAAGIVIT